MYAPLFETPCRRNPRVRNRHVRLFAQALAFIVVHAVTDSVAHEKFPVKMGPNIASQPLLAYVVQRGMESEQYTSVQVIEAGLTGASMIARRSYHVGQDGVTAILALPDLRVRVVRTGYADFDFWPQNVVLGTPLRTSCPVQSESSALVAEPPCPTAAASPARPNSGVAQTDEHLPVKQGDVGSTPTPGAEARVAQLVEPLICNQEVAGSSPASGSPTATPGWTRKGRKR